MTNLFDPGVRLKRCIERQEKAQHGLSSTDRDFALRMMREVRGIIERDQARSAFPTASFFSDWMVHNEINGPPAQNLLERLNESFAQGEPLDLSVSLALGTPLLRQELITILRMEHASLELVETASLWLRFTSLLFHIVAYRPAGFRGSNPSSDERNRVSRLRERVAVAFGFSDPTSTPYFRRLAILEPVNASNNFTWELEFDLDQNSTFTRAGLLVFHDPKPFRNNDLGLRFIASEADARRATEGLLAVMPTPAMKRSTWTRERAPN